jgi:hypothetical protein
MTKEKMERSRKVKIQRRRRVEDEEWEREK